MLQQAGYDITVAEELMALPTAQTVLPDVILLDLSIAGENSYEICRQLKSSPDTSDISIVFLSYRNDTEEKVRGFEVGGADFITKPLQVPEVLARVRNQVDQKRVRNQLKEQTQLLQQEIKNRLAVEEALQKANYELERLNKIDGLTLLANRLYFDEYLESNWRQMQREAALLSLIICNVDLFKLYNETYGHHQGDESLQKIAQAITRAVKRPADLVARYGGEEFSILLPKTDASGAITVAKHIQRELQGMAIPHSRSPQNHLTISIGVSIVEPQPQLEPEVLVATAEQALYQAKQEGRNRIIFKMVVLPDSPNP
jgi:diguanylate cyclase (GGDEF)-like protein